MPSALRIKHGTRYEVKEAIRNTVDLGFGMTRGRSAMPTRHITSYSTTSSRAIDTFPPALAAIDVKNALDLQYAIAPLAKAHFGRYGTPLVISAYGASAGAVGVFALAAAVANWPDWFLSP